MQTKGAFGVLRLRRWRRLWCGLRLRLGFRLGLGFRLRIIGGAADATAGSRDAEVIVVEDEAILTRLPGCSTELC